jgi:hypothetical protein
MLLIGGPEETARRLVLETRPVVFQKLAAGGEEQPVLDQGEFILNEGGLVTDLACGGIWSEVESVVEGTGLEGNINKPVA